MPAPAVFVDESKAKEYLLVAASIAPGDSGRQRQAMRALLLRGQPRLHMKKERDSRKQQILNTIGTLGAHITIYCAPRTLGSELERRVLCLDRLVHDLGTTGGRLCLERDESLIGRDRQCLIEATRAVGSTESLTYWHESAASEPLLSIPDAVGWAWARGVEWRRRASAITIDVVEVSR